MLHSARFEAWIIFRCLMIMFPPEKFRSEGIRDKARPGCADCNDGFVVPPCACASFFLMGSGMSSSCATKAAEIRGKYLEGRPDILAREKIASLAEPSERNPACADLTVLQWNLLAYGLSALDGEGGNQGDFLCQAGALDWPQRRAMILEDMLAREPDIIACQEMDDFKFFLRNLPGYGGIFQAKPNSPCLIKANNIGPDGCAIFYRTKRLELISYGHKPLKEGNKDTNSLVLYARFKDLEAGGRCLNIATTHLKAKEDPKSAATRLAQASDLVGILGDELDSSPNLICCGDFNGDPSEPFYSVMSGGAKKMESAYASVMPGGSEPNWTTWKKRAASGLAKKRCIDYIWYNPDGLHVKEVLDLPKDDQVTPHLLPSLSYPSDHISLWAKFHYVDKG